MACFVPFLSLLTADLYAPVKAICPLLGFLPPTEHLLRLSRAMLTILHLIGRCHRVKLSFLF